MPYINKDNRAALARGEVVPTTAGELNYCLTMKCLQYLNNEPLSYQAINDVIGALEGAKLELYRRMAAPYENEKIAQNGDVY